MKKKFIFIVTVFVCFGGVAGAATKCVKLDASVGIEDSWHGGAEWTAILSDGVVISGVEVCSETAPTAFADLADRLSFDSDVPRNNGYCWCKMMSPAASKWVAGSGSFNPLCWETCSCGSAAWTPVFLEAMFGSVQ